MEAKKITLFLFLFGIFIFLTVYIGLQAYLYYKTTTSYVDSESPLIGSCQGFFFEIDSISYMNTSLSFNILNKALSEKGITYLTVVSGTRSKDVNVTVRPGESAAVVMAGVSIKDGSFAVYPDGCKMFGKRYSVK